MHWRWWVKFLSLLAYLLFSWLFAGLLRHQTRVLESYLHLQTVGMVFFPVFFWKEDICWGLRPRKKAFAGERVGFHIKCSGMTNHELCLYCRLGLPSWSCITCSLPQFSDSFFSDSLVSSASEWSINTSTLLSTDQPTRGLVSGASQGIPQEKSYYSLPKCE